MDLTLPGGMELAGAAWLGVVIALCLMVAWFASQNRRLTGGRTAQERIEGLEQILTDQRAAFAQDRRRQEEADAQRPVASMETDRQRATAFAHGVREIAGAPDQDRLVDAVGRFLVRVAQPTQWMIFLAVGDDSDDLVLAGSGTDDGGTVWPMGKRLDTRAGRLGLVVKRRCFMHAADFSETGPLVGQFLDQSEPPGFRVDAAVPLIVRDRAVALISVGTQHPSTETLRPVLEFVRECVALALQSIAARRRAEQSKSRDDLTGLYNKGHFSARASEFCYQNRSQHVPNALVLVCVDDFRGYVNRSGHAAGDRLLHAVTERLVDLFGLDALVGRWGPDEFVVYVGGWEAERITQHADALRGAIAACGWPAAPGASNRFVTLSAGIGASHTRTYDDLVSLASDNLVQARWAGGNQVCADDGMVEDTDHRGREPDADPVAEAATNAEITGEIRL